MPEPASFTLRAARWLLFGSSLVALTSTRVAHAQDTSVNQTRAWCSTTICSTVSSGRRMASPRFRVMAGRPARTQLLVPRTNFLPEL